MAKKLLRHKRYQHGTLPQPKDGSLFIRILTLYPGQDDDQLRCSIRAVQIGKEVGDESYPVEYEALSYYWGDPTPVEVIHVDEVKSPSEIPLHKSLYDALIGLRSPTSERTLWTDAICINQSNIDERTAQVRIMHKIYQSAAHVVVWLTKPFSRTSSWRPKKAFEIIEHLYALSREELNAADGGTGGTASLPQTRQRFHSSHAEAMKYIRTIFRCVWFGRMWIIQEISSSKKATVTCSDGVTIDFGRLIAGVKFAMEKRLFRTKSDYPWGVFGDTRTERHFLSGLAAATQMEAIGNRTSNSGDGILQYLNRFSGSQCSDPRDKIFGLYGISELHHEKDLAAAFRNEELKPDYRKGSSELYIAVAKFCLRLGSLDILSRGTVESHKVSGLPSWAPDWSVGSFSKTVGSLALTEKYATSSGSRANPIFTSNKSCKLEGILVSTVDAICSRERLLASVSGKGSSRGLYAVHWGTWFRQFVQWERSYHDESSRYPYSNEPFSDVFCSMFKDARLPYETQWFLPGLGPQTPNRVSDEIIPKALEEYHDFAKTHISRYAVKATFTKLVLLTRLSILCLYFGPILKFGIYDEQIMLERNVFASSEGHFGFGPANVARGDKIAILKGSKVPLILRPSESEEGAFRLIGDAYVHGIMQGEAYNENACSPIVLE